MHRLVAIKELYPGGSERRGTTVTIPDEYTHERWSKAIGSFSREAQILSGLDYPGIVTVYDHFEENNTAYMVMRYISGINLAQVAEQRGGRLPEAEVLSYLVEVGDALNVLHKNMMLHRDIKPSNIMLDGQGHTVLIDFGAARAFIPDKTATYSVVLTHGFAPPEQLMGRGRLGPTADIYALAATCYYLLTKKLPAFGEEDDSKLHADGNRIPPHLLRVLEHGLAFNLADRPHDVPQFLAELQGRTAVPSYVGKPAVQAQPLSASIEDAQNYETEVPDVLPASPGTPAMRDSPAIVDGNAEQRMPGRLSLHDAPTLPNNYDPAASAGTLPSSKAAVIPFDPSAHKHRQPGVSWVVAASTLAALVLLAGVITLLSGKSSSGSTETPSPVITSESPSALLVVVLQTATGEMVRNNTGSATALSLSTQLALSQAAGATHTSQTQAAVQFSATAQAQAGESAGRATSQAQNTAQARMLATVQAADATGTAEAQGRVQATAQALAQQNARQSTAQAQGTTQAQEQATAQALAQVQTTTTAQFQTQATSQAALAANATGTVQAQVQATAQVVARAQAHVTQTSQALETAGQVAAAATAKAQTTAQVQVKQATAQSQALAQQATAQVRLQATAQTQAAQSTAQAQSRVQAAAQSTAQAANPLIRTLNEHSDLVLGGVAFSPDGLVLASGVGNTVKLWRVSDGVLLRTFAGHTDQVGSVSFSPDGRMLASGSADKTVKLWRVSDGTLLRTLTGNTDWPGHGRFSPDGLVLASGVGNTVKLWRVSDGTLLPTLAGMDSDPRRVVDEVAFSPDGQTVAVGSGQEMGPPDEKVQLWRVRDGSLIRTLNFNDYLGSLVFSSDGQTLAAGGQGGTVQFWRVGDGSLIRSLKYTDMTIVGAFSPDLQTLAAEPGPDWKLVQLWKVADGSLVSTLQGHTDQVTTLAFSPDGQMLASGSLDNTVKLWRVH